MAQHNIVFTELFLDQLQNDGDFAYSAGIIEGVKQGECYRDSRCVQTNKLIQTDMLYQYMQFVAFRTRRGRKHRLLCPGSACIHQFRKNCVPCQCRIPSFLGRTIAIIGFPRS